MTQRSHIVDMCMTCGLKDCIGVLDQCKSCYCKEAERIGNFNTMLAVVKTGTKREFEDFGGKAEQGETPKQACVREFNEEAGEWVAKVCGSYYIIGSCTYTTPVNGKTWKSYVQVILLETILTREEAQMTETAEWKDKAFKNMRSAIRLIAITDLSTNFDVPHASYTGKTVTLASRLRRAIRRKDIREWISEAAKIRVLDELEHAKYIDESTPTD